MKVLVDTCVWSLALRRANQSTSPEATALAQMISSGQTVLLLGIVLQEILQSVHSQEQLSKLKASLGAFPLLTAARENYEYAAQLFTACRQKGLQVTTVDCLIAATAIQNDFQLFTTDKDFVQIAAMAPLKLFKLLN